MWFCECVPLLNFKWTLYRYEYDVERMAKQTLSDKGSQIDGFIQNLVELKKSFDTGVNVQIAVVSARIQDKVEAIGLWILLRVFAIEF